jgi:hypothetical protein
MYSDRTEALLGDLHQTMGAPMFSGIFNSGGEPEPRPRPDLSGAIVNSSVDANGLLMYTGF